MYICPNCRSEVEKGTPYCPYCGIHIIWDEFKRDDEDLEDLFILEM